MTVKLERTIDVSMLATLTSRRDHNFRVLNRKETPTELMNSLPCTKESAPLPHLECIRRYSTELTLLWIARGFEVDTIPYGIMV